MPLSSYQSWCRIVGEEIISSLSDNDKKRIEIFDKNLSADKAKKSELEISLEEDVVKFLSMTPKQRTKAKFLKEDSMRIAIIYFSLYALQRAHNLIDTVECSPHNGPYRETIAYYARLANNLRRKVVKPILSGDGFPNDSAFSL